jgi:hypothetical protein
MARGQLLKGNFMSTRILAYLATLVSFAALSTQPTVAATRYRSACAASARTNPLRANDLSFPRLREKFVQRRHDRLAFLLERPHQSPQFI